ncbi:MAG: hypothetical protein AB8H03_10970 [Saprospiraceae bacterium]
MRKLLLLLSILFSISTYSQDGNTNSTNARSNGVANASVGFTGINSIFNNQAGLAELENMGLLFSAEQRFVLNDLNNLGVGFAIPTNSGTFGLSVTYFGFEDFNQSKIGLTYARKLMEKLSVGIQFDMLSTQIQEYGNKNLFTFEIGIQSELIENLLLGFHLFNPVKLEIIEDEFLPTIIRAGASYSASKKLMLHTELEKDFDFPFVFKAGIEYELTNDFWLRIGVHTNPTALSFGLGYRMKNGLRFDLASNYHQELGFTPSVGVGFDFVKKKKK